MHLKRYYIGILLVILLITIILICVYANIDTKNIYELNTEVDPIIKMFPMITCVKESWWIYEPVGNNRTIGPSNYRVTALIKISNEEMYAFQKEYLWEQTQVHLDKTIFSNISFMHREEYWYNSDFEQKILSGAFVGRVYVDFNNSNIYVIVENKS